MNNRITLRELKQTVSLLHLTILLYLSLNNLFLVRVILARTKVILKPMSKPEFSLSDTLNKWYNDHNISHSTLKSLLGILKPYHTELPLDPRTLLGTKSVKIEPNVSGHFACFGLEENMTKYCVIDDTVDTGISIIKLDINIDGVLVFKSQNTSFWPILC